jgi:glycosyltransferase involved in cell wall biosynthesis
MRLLIATPLYPPDLGGPATYTRLLETGLEGQGFEAPIIVKFGDVRTSPKVVRHVQYFWHVFRAAKHVDVILALDPVSVGVPALMAARLRRKTFVVKIVGDYAWEQGVQRFGVKDSLDKFVRHGRIPFMVAVLRAVQTHVAKSATKIIVPSEYLRGIVKAWGVPTEKISVIYNAIEIEKGGVVPETVMAQPSPKIVTAGRLVPWKCIDGIIDAVAALDSSATLIIVGEGSERTVLEKRAAEKLPGRVIFTGPCSHTDTLAVLRDADMFVLNSTYEGLSHVLIEALMTGMPIVATRAGGNTELITDGENGLLVSPHDTAALTAALERLLTDAPLRDRLAANAKTSSERFTTGTMLEKTAAFLKTI